MHLIKWLVVANSIEALIYQLKNKQANEIHQLMHEKGRLRTSELTSDKPGRFTTDKASQGGYQPASDAHELEQQNFAKQIAALLDNGRKISTMMN